MDDPVGALIGAILMGFGTLIMFGAFKNKKIFGANGLLATALTTGSLVKSQDIPEAFKSFATAPISIPSNSDVLKGIVNTVTGNDTKAAWNIPVAVRDAIVNISKTDPTLATKIADMLNKVDSSTKRITLMPLGQLLLIADMKGHQADVSVIRNYVKELTGDAI